MSQAAEKLVNPEGAGNDGAESPRLSVRRTASGTNLLGTPSAETTSLSPDWLRGPSAMTALAYPGERSSHGGSISVNGAPEAPSAPAYVPGKLSPRAFAFTNGDASQIHVADAILGDAISTAREDPKGTGREAVGGEVRSLDDGSGTGSGSNGVSGGGLGASAGVESRENFVVLLRVRPLQEKEASAGEICAWEVVEPASVRALFAAPKAGRAAPPPLRTASAPPPPSSMNSQAGTALVASTSSAATGTSPGSSPGLTAAQGPSPQRHSPTPLPLSSRPTWNFDKVFGPSSGTHEVYRDGGVRDLVLSTLHGINASVFAYGMTGSGKTFTMNGIMDMALADIFERMKQSRWRQFSLRFSAVEIYNEVVRDLLDPSLGPLRLLDDPERGTVVEKLTEELVGSAEHARRLLEKCEAERSVGETFLNDVSSRSHQIVRLTVESNSQSPSFLGSLAGSGTPNLSDSSGPAAGQGAGGPQLLTATLNFVDLAGSERSTQTGAEGARLKEGAHINRSLLTLGTVIRKLSAAAAAASASNASSGASVGAEAQKRRKPGKGGLEGQGSGAMVLAQGQGQGQGQYSGGGVPGASQGLAQHVPYRDSKLTRILQQALGGNGRTLILGCVSPSLAHLDHTRNTLAFATAARLVRTAARVNVVMSDKALVAMLQREVGQLQAQLQRLQADLTSTRAQLLLSKHLPLPLPPTPGTALSAEGSPGSATSAGPGVPGANQGSALPEESQAFTSLPEVVGSVGGAARGGQLGSGSLSRLGSGAVLGAYDAGATPALGVGAAVAQGRAGALSQLLSPEAEAEAVRSLEREMGEMRMLRRASEAAPPPPNGGATPPPPATAPALEEDASDVPGATGATGELAGISSGAPGATALLVETRLGVLGPTGPLTGDEAVGANSRLRENRGTAQKTPCLDGPGEKGGRLSQGKILPGGPGYTSEWAQGSAWQEGGAGEGAQASQSGRGSCSQSDSGSGSGKGSGSGSGSGTVEAGSSDTSGDHTPDSANGISGSGAPGPQSQAEEGAAGFLGDQSLRGVSGVSGGSGGVPGADGSQEQAMGGQALVLGQVQVQGQGQGLGQGLVQGVGLGMGFDAGLGGGKGGLVGVAGADTLMRLEARLQLMQMSLHDIDHMMLASPSPSASASPSVSASFPPSTASSLTSLPSLPSLPSPSPASSPTTLPLSPLLPPSLPPFPSAPLPSPPPSPTKARAGVFPAPGAAREPDAQAEEGTGGQSRVHRGLDKGEAPLGPSAGPSPGLGARAGAGRQGDEEGGRGTEASGAPAARLEQDGGDTWVQGERGERGSDVRKGSWRGIRRPAPLLGLNTRARSNLATHGTRLSRGSWDTPEAHPRPRQGPAAEPLAQEQARDEQAWEPGTPAAHRSSRGPLTQGLGESASGASGPDPPLQSSASPTTDLASSTASFASGYTSTAASTAASATASTSTLGSISAGAHGSPGTSEREGSAVGGAEPGTKRHAGRAEGAREAGGEPPSSGQHGAAHKSGVAVEAEVGKGAGSGGRAKAGAGGGATGAAAGAGAGVGAGAGGRKGPRGVDARRMLALFKAATEDNLRSVKAYVAELREQVLKLHFQKQLLVAKVLELEAEMRALTASAEEEQAAGAPKEPLPLAQHEQSGLTGAGATKSPKTTTGDGTAAGSTAATGNSTATGSSAATGNSAAIGNGTATGSSAATGVPNGPKGATGSENKVAVIPGQLDGLLRDLGDLWHQQGAPLAHRTQVFLYLLSLGLREAIEAARGEAQRLRWLLGQAAEAGERGVRGPGLEGERRERGAGQDAAGTSAWTGLARALGVPLRGACEHPVAWEVREERRRMARVLETEFSAQEREALYSAFGIPLSVKRRKWRLLTRLWDPLAPVLPGPGLPPSSAEGEGTLQALRLSALLTCRLLRISPPALQAGGAV